MDPQQQFCHHPACPARGQVGQGNSGGHSQQEQRYIGSTCRRTFAATTGPPFSRRHSAADVVTLVLVLLSHGCPLPAVVAAFGVEERTVPAWLARAGTPCAQVHEHLVRQGQVDLHHVQADELWVKLVGQRVWLARALAVPSRLWLGGVVSAQRDGGLIRPLVARVRARARALAVLVGVEGWSSYGTAFRRGFRQPVHTGRRGRPRLVVAADCLLGQVVKQYAQRWVVSVSHRAREGTAAASAAVLAATGTGTVITTAYLERLKGTFRGGLAVLVRRGRALARTMETLTAGGWLVGCAYNCCWEQASLRRLAPAGSGRQGQEQTPAMAAGLTDHPWTLSALLHYQVPPPAWVTPKRRGRPPKRIPQPALPRAA